MIDFRYLHLGLTGLARAHRANTMAGHLGAAVVAGFFFGEDHPGFDPEVLGAVRGELDRVMDGDEALWFDSGKAGVTVPELFELFPDEPAREEAIPGIGEALSRNIGQLRRSLPDVEGELGALVKAEKDPRDPGYWAMKKDSAQWSAWLTHRIKTLYGFHAILPLIEDEAKRRRAEEAFLYLMG